MTPEQTDQASMTTEHTDQILMRIIANPKSAGWLTVEESEDLLRITEDMNTFRKKIGELILFALSLKPGENRAADSIQETSENFEYIEHRICHELRRKIRTEAIILKCSMQTLSNQALSKTYRHPPIFNKVGEIAKPTSTLTIVGEIVGPIAKEIWKAIKNPVNLKDLLFNTSPPPHPDNSTQLSHGNHHRA